MKEKVRGMMFGVAIGDALGQPYENQPPLGHPVNAYKGAGGLTTDDWQMTAALARALIKGNGFDMDVIVKEHIAAYDDTTRGWGGGHRESCAALKKGVSPKESGKMALSPLKPYRGRGNGMCMKISPMAAYHHAKNIELAHRMSSVAELTMMTHATSMGLSSAVGMQDALIYCLKQTPATFDPGDFLASVLQATKLAETWVQNEEGDLGDKMSVRIKGLCETWDKMTPEDVSHNYKGGGYVYESFPFSLAFFCMGKHDASCVYDCVGSGGDTDTNGSMVAALVGALHGEEVFSKPLLYKLLGFPDIELLCGQFADWCESISVPQSA